ncbi:hypothetical protein ACKI1J_43175 [Streptomyces scabiei]|uniref:hypothetical protein n=1 Tax=Streptomyces TaxID=1883 RepID=UPI0029B7A806|nr:hypothetical protein [Streptomyces stelliscabiei]MDX2552621.1 hypothetical protein [Streptomyces stelliscabiei]
MTYTWSDPPTSLPEPQQINLGFRKQWGATLDDSHTVTGTVQFSTGGEPGKTNLDVINDFVADMATAGWQLYTGTSPQEITRTLEET